MMVHQRRTAKILKSERKWFPRGMSEAHWIAHSFIFIPTFPLRKVAGKHSQEDLKWPTVESLLSLQREIIEIWIPKNN